MSTPNTTTWEIAANFMDNVAGEVAQFLYLTINEPDVDKFTKQYTESDVDKFIKQYTESIEGVTKRYLR